MKGGALVTTVIVTTSLIWGAPTQAKVTDQQVQATIKKIVERLYALQNERGTWDPEQPASGPDHVFGTNYGGTTALVTYALLTAGESYQSPRLRRAVEFLASEKTPMNGVYAVGLRNHVWAHLPPSFELQLKRDTKWLLEAQGGGPAKGAYHYTPAQSKAGSFDNSVTQYGVLGTWEAAKRGIPIPTTYWELVGRHFVATQQKDGGWCYLAAPAPNHPVTGSMTASGLACMFIVQDHLFAHEFRKVGEAAKHPVTAKINGGLEWFDKNFAATLTGKVPAGPVYYYLLGVERIGLASGYKYFGGLDWYAAGAELLVRNPGAAPSDLSFSLLFLVRGRVPLFANKLRIPGYEWHNRPRDLSRLAAWVSDEVEQEMNWQIVDITSNPEEWLDAPILYIAGHQPLKLTPDQEQKIKRYIDLGGLVITTADDGDPGFTRSVTEMFERLYPQHKLQRLSPKDDLMDLVFPLQGERLGAQSLHNGVRHLALHIPRDLSWTLHSSSHTDDYAWQFLTNAYYYATEKGQARPRLDQHYLARGAGGGPKITVARVRHEGNWDPEPLAWEVQSNAMFNAKKADVTPKVVEWADLPQSGAKFAHVVGTGPVTFSQEQVQAIKQFAAAGGVLLFENAGGRGEFSKAVLDMLAAELSDQPARPLSLQSDLVTGKRFQGYDVSRADYRSFTVLRSGRFRGPRLQAVSFEGEPRILVSGEDLTMGMLDQPVWGVYGYSSQAAQQLMTNLVLWSQQPAATAAAPATPAAAPAPSK
jgi:hypothetical protein